MEGNTHEEPEGMVPVCDIIIARMKCCVNGARVCAGAPLCFNFWDYKIMADNIRRDYMQSVVQNINQIAYIIASAGTIAFHA